MAQPIRKAVAKSSSIKPKKRTPKRSAETRKIHANAWKRKSRVYKRKGSNVGTSKLEEKFAKEFLDKLGIQYVRQWPMGSTGRFCDFGIVKHNILIEIDGDYFHGYGLLYEEMNAIQKKNNIVDRYKNQWALENNFKMVRIWEHEIKKEPLKVMQRLKKLFGITDKRPIKKIL